MKDLWIASSNPKKRAELDRLLAPLGYTLHSLDELPDPPRFVEDRPDFAGNAEVKAVALAQHVGALAVGDDSGLCVDALDGAPGVHSARWAGPDATDADRIERLLGELDNLRALGQRTERSARFVCHLCLAGPDGAVLERVEETCEGVILDAPRGHRGFGYDPVFAPDELPADITAESRSPAHTPTFAELSPAAKDAVSHRGKALRALARRLGDRFDSSTP